MKRYEPSRLPALNASAREFAVCGNWFSSIPEPTWLNRYFVHGASSVGLVHNLTREEIVQWFVDGLALPERHNLSTSGTSGEIQSSVWA
jgi:phospholipase C